MSEGSFCVVDRFWQRWYHGFVDVIVQINPGLSRWTQRATPDSGLSKGEIHMAFESDYAKMKYLEKDNAVFHVWKKEAHLEDYRKPVTESLKMLRDHKGSIFIVDARNGFEDTQEDVEWGFGFFLPELKKTGCRIWGFILPAISEIEGEIDLWTREFEKNFRVVRGESYEDVLGEARRFL